MTAISADARKALRNALTNHAGWDAYRAKHGLSLATMVRDDYVRACADLNIEIPASAGPARSSNSSPKDAPAMSVNSGLDPDQFPSRGASRADATARAKADFATASAQDDFPAADAPTVDANDDFQIPAMPTPATGAQMAKIDSLIAIGVDPDLTSYTDLFAKLGGAVHAASVLQARLDAAPAADPNAARMDRLTKPSLDFVPPTWSRDLVDFLEIGATVAIVGPAGNGKTTGARKLLERDGWNVYEFDCTDATLPQDLIGRTSLKQDNGATVTEWSPGPLARAFADPKGAVLLNEYDALDPRTGMALQSALEAADRRRVTAPDSGDQIESAGPCPIVLTLNTIGHGANMTYQGRNALGGANRDRVEIIVTDYEAEREIMVAHGYEPETADRLATWAKEVRAKLASMNSKEILSNRRLLTAAALIDRRGHSLVEATRRAFFCRMPENELKRFPGMA